MNEPSREPGIASRTLALTLAALDLAPSFAHLLESYPRLAWWPLELWRDATVFNGQFAAFGVLGGPLEIATIAVTGWLAWRLRDPAARRLAVAACGLFVAALVLWIAIVAPANAALATWQPGPLPADAAAVRTRWEAGHIASAVAKLTGFVLFAAAAVRRDRLSPIP